METIRILNEQIRLQLKDFSERNKLKGNLAPTKELSIETQKRL